MMSGLRGSVQVDGVSHDGCFFFDVAEPLRGSPGITREDQG